MLRRVRIAALTADAHAAQHGTIAGPTLRWLLEMVEYARLSPMPIFDTEYRENRCPVCTKARKGNRVAKILQCIEMLVTFGGPVNPIG